MMTRAVRALCGFTHEKLGVKRIEIKCATGNIPSNRIPLLRGFHLDRIERNAELLTGGETVDANIWVLELKTTPL